MFLRPVSNSDLYIKVQTFIVTKDENILWVCRLALTQNKLEPPGKRESQLIKCPQIGLWKSLYYIFLVDN